MNRICPICNNFDKTILFEVLFSEYNSSKFGLPNKNEIVCCNNCGFTFADNNANQQNYDNYYINNNIYADDLLIKSEKGYEHEIISIIEKYISKDLFIVDIGFGDGTLLKSLKKRGYGKLAGMDPGHESVELLKKEGISAYEQSIFDVIPDDIHHVFDVVITTCVGEHIFDLETFIKNQIILLKNSGKIIIQVPAVEGFEKHYTPLPNYFNCEHINYFSLVSLDNLLSKFGFSRITSDEDSIFINHFDEYILAGVYEYDGKIKCIKDDKSCVSIKNYYNKYLELNKSETEKIKEFIQKHNKVVLWGCGSFSIQLFAKYPDLKKSIVYAVDNNSKIQENGFEGLKVYSPKELFNNPYPVLICSMLNGKDIAKEIDEMSLSLDYFLF